MCGIFAAFNINNQTLNEQQLILAVKAVSHRGPDNLSYFNDGICFLGHTRLSIIGLEENGNQPFYFENFVLVFNGEIFNFIELRNELITLGYDFKTESDTEVVIKAFHKWGNDCFAKFNGMWSIIIYDKIKKTLSVSRDRFGQKPLFLLKTQDNVFFASEIHQLAPFSNNEIDYGLIQMFLKEGTFSGGSRTFFKEIEIFPKAYNCEIDINGNNQSARYWDYYTGEIYPTNEASFAEFSNLLEDAVKIRLRTDVPIGFLLSGGVDSTIIAAYASKYNSSDTHTPAFTYCAHDEDNEEEFARYVAEKLHMEIHTREQDEDPIAFRERLKLLVKHLGRGHSSPAIVSIDYLYELVSQAGIKVALDGQGADELLAGYKHYHFVAISMFLFKGELRQAFYCLKDMLNSKTFLTVLVLFLRNKLPESAKKIMRRIYGYERFFKNYKTDHKAAFIEKQINKKKNKNALNRYLEKQHDIGLENLLYYGDIVAMNNSVENRSPFMDHRLVDFAFSHSEKLKLWDGIDKYILRTLPLYEQFRSVLDRKKVGFSSNIKPNTKLHLIEELKKSPVLEWPIFSKTLKKFLLDDGFKAKKYELLLFRLYQVHLWNEVFQVEKNKP